ncbi:MAG: hypothetical protein VW270_18245 [Candidatus Poseidoniales archaeon]
MRYVNPYQVHRTSTTNNNMIATKKRFKTNKRSKRDREQERLQDKANSPGVPPNTCPYIDMVKTIMDDMAAAYERLYEKGERQPKFDDMKQLADDTIEYVRRANETLRDNSGYWYEKYKQLL